MKLKKNPSDNHYYLHSDQDQPLICPHQDQGTEVVITPNKLQPNMPPKQEIIKKHLVCGSWCALFSLYCVAPDGEAGKIDQGCNRFSDGFYVEIEK